MPENLILAYTPFYSQGIEAVLPSLSYMCFWEDTSYLFLVTPLKQFSSLKSLVDEGQFLLVDPLQVIFDPKLKLLQVIY